MQIGTALFAALACDYAIVPWEPRLGRAGRRSQRRHARAAAIPTRLAFARLLAGGGQPTPVILDDTLSISTTTASRRCSACCTAKPAPSRSSSSPAANLPLSGSEAMRCVPRPGNPKTERDTSRPRHVGFRGTARHRFMALVRSRFVWPASRVAPIALLTAFCPVAMRRPPT